MWIVLVLVLVLLLLLFFFSSRRRHTRLVSDWSSDVCSSDLAIVTLHALNSLHWNFRMIEKIGRQLQLPGVRSVGATARDVAADLRTRSEERRVGKECRSRWSPYH